MLGLHIQDDRCCDDNRVKREDISPVEEDDQRVRRLDRPALQSGLPEEAEIFFQVHHVLGVDERDGVDIRCDNLPDQHVKKVSATHETKFSQVGSALP